MRRLRRFPVQFYHQGNWVGSEWVMGINVTHAHKMACYISRTFIADKLGVAMSTLQQVSWEITPEAVEVSTDLQAKTVNAS